MEQLICKDLTIGYGQVALVKNLNFTVNQGDYLCIVGENGAGKTTLMKTLLHLKKPLGGSIKFCEGVTQKDIGYLQQQNQIQSNFPATVYEVVSSGCQNKSFIRPFYTKKEKELIKLNIDRMELTGLEKKCFTELSGGQQQRVLLARALCSTEKILLLDEPVAGLDPHVSSEMYSLIEKLNKEFGTTIIMISHDVSGFIKYASKILHIGDEIFFGTKDEYLNSEIGKKFISYFGGK
ncbi:MAG: metal ABC transporter ATP-binding protein [Clostridia bacterium]|nr:metal ABC transporter ATP-binding protein [Clostridia bacterium]